jgi:hypothetical protein
MSAPRLSQAQKNSMIEAYLNGVSIDLLATTYGVDRSYPGLLAKRSGEKLRLSVTARGAMSLGAHKRRRRKQ